MNDDETPPIPAPAPAPAAAAAAAAPSVAVAVAGGVGAGVGVAVAADDPNRLTLARLTHYAGFDWARSEHQVVLVDPRGAIVLSLRFADDAEGWAQFRQKTASFASLGVATETNCGPAVERLLDLGLALYPLNPKAAERYRDRKAPAGAKDDDLDAWSFADALRTDGHGWRPLRPQDPLTTGALKGSLLIV